MTHEVMMDLNTFLQRLLLSLVTCLLVHVFGNYAENSVTFKASMCYDSQGHAQVQLRCPVGFQLETLTAFTGVSRSNSCFFEPWDCVLHEGSAQRCDGRKFCTVKVIYPEVTKQHFRCSNGTQLFFHVEYLCSNKEGVFAMATEITPVAPLILTTPPTVKIQNESQETFVEKTPSPLTVTEEKLTLLAIIGGSILGLLLVIAVIVILIQRLKQRPYDDSNLYGPLSRPGSSTSSLPNPSLESDFRCPSIQEDYTIPHGTRRHHPIGTLRSAYSMHTIALPK